MSDDHSAQGDSPLDPASMLASVQWNQLEEIVDRYCAALESSAPVSMEAFLPSKGGLRRAALVELVKTDLDWQRDLGMVAQLDDYLDRWPELGDPCVPVDLLVEDVLSRQRHGLSVDIPSLVTRFPHARQALENLRLDDPFATVTRANSPRPVDLQPGMTIGDFELLTRLGKGSFATVFLARQQSMQRLVALKVSADRGFEGQTLAQLDHPNIVRVFDQVSDQHPMTGSPIRLMYMQYVPGGTLGECLSSMRRHERAQWSGRLLEQVLNEGLQRRGESAAMPKWLARRLAETDWPTCVATIGAFLADALAAAHRQRILHRDVKPANVLVDRDGAPKLVDFNVSAADRVAGTTAASQFGGSLPYMSPEQLEVLDPSHPRRADRLEHDTDLYALSVMLYEMLTGSRPFDDVAPASDWGESLQRMVRIRRDQPRRDQLRRALQACPWDVPSLLIDIILLGLHPQPAQRFHSAEAMANALHMAGDEDQAKWLARPRGLRQWMTRHPEWVCLTIGAGISAIGATFVVTYNAIQAVPPESFGALLQTIIWVDSLAFSAGIGLIYWLARPIGRFLRGGDDLGARPPAAGSNHVAEPAARSHASHAQDEASLGVPQMNRDSHGAEKNASADSHASPAMDQGGASSEVIRTAIRRDLSVAHWGALVCLTLWDVAGVAFPTVLTLAGVRLGVWGWIDFLASNVLAGLLSASWAFMLIAWFAIWYWLPAIVRAGLRQTRDFADRPAVARLRRHITAYQLVALGVPMLAMVLLIARDQPQTKFALIAISLFSIPGCIAQSALASRLLRGLRLLDSRSEDSAVE